MSKNAPTLDTLIAHSAPEGGRVQSMREHMQGVADLAAAFAQVFGSAPFGAWLGWWHDAGKVAPDVQQYLRGETKLKRGPDHSSAGMLEAWERAPYLANLIAGHHGGLADSGDLRNRVKAKKKVERVTGARQRATALLAGVIPPPSADALPAFIRNGSQGEQKRRLCFWMRMLHSALVDADCLDTEAHFNPDQAALRTHDDADMAALRDRLEAAQETLIAGAEETVINQIRAELYRQCVGAADLPPGFFSLSVPTGGGKTRSVMAFALRHAAQHGQRRVVVALPYTSIIEQNAAVYREVLGDEAVLEHHSAVHHRQKPEAESDEQERALRLAADNWDAPVVVTTNVQFFESLFAARNSRLRKLHRLARSVIVLDEAQTLPPELLFPTLEALRFLVEDYGCTIVFCTATQPAFRTSYGDPNYGPRFEGFAITEIVADRAALYQQLRRVNYDVQTETPWTWAEAAARMQQAHQALAIVNTVADAQALFAAVGSEHVYHLSAGLCPVHRRRVLAAVKARLKRRLPVYLVATQVVEAGVDISFPLVLRAQGPLDSLIQAAGRCNREGEMEGRGEVVIFVPEEGGMPPGAYKRGNEQTRILQQEYPRDFAERLHDPDLGIAYFRRLYGGHGANLDKSGILDKEERQLFRQVAQHYRFIDETVGVVVPYAPDDDPDLVSKREAVLHRLQQHEQAWRSDWRALQPFMVNLRQPQFDKAVDRGLCVEVVPGVWRWCGAYDSRLRGCGLLWKNAADEALIC